MVRKECQAAVHITWGVSGRTSATRESTGSDPSWSSSLVNAALLLLGLEAHLHLFHASLRD